MIINCESLSLYEFYTVKVTVYFISRNDVRAKVGLTRNMRKSCSFIAKTYVTLALPVSMRVSTAFGKFKCIKLQNYMNYNLR
jgi:hypothetical protein